MDIDARPLRCFLAIAEEQSFSRAAERLHVTQPTLSAQIRTLERYLGFPLFERSTRRVELSPKGRALLDSARHMVDASDRLKRVAATLARSDARDLSIGAAFYTIDIPERIALIEGFIAAHPDIRVDVDTRWQSELLLDLHRGRLDVLFMIGMPVPRRQLSEALSRGEGTEVLFADDLRYRVLRTEPVALLVPAESELAALACVTPAALARREVVMLGGGHGSALTDPINGYLLAAGAIPVVPPESHGIGVERYGRQFRMPAITLGWFNEHMDGDGRMVRRPLDALGLSTSILLVGNAEVMSGAAETFWRYVDATR